MKWKEFEEQLQDMGYRFMRENAEGHWMWYNDEYQVIFTDSNPHNLKSHGGQVPPRWIASARKTIARAQARRAAHEEAARAVAEEEKQEQVEEPRRKKDRKRGGKQKRK